MRSNISRCTLMTDDDDYLLSHFHTGSKKRKWKVTLVKSCNFFLFINKGIFFTAGRMMLILYRWHCTEAIAKTLDPFSSPAVVPFSVLNWKPFTPLGIHYCEAAIHIAVWIAFQGSLRLKTEKLRRGFGKEAFPSVLYWDWFQYIFRAWRPIQIRRRFRVKKEEKKRETTAKCEMRQGRLREDE